MTVLAVTRDDVAQYVSAVFFVYMVLILIRIVLSWVPRTPDNRALRAFVGFVQETTDPYLNLFRRFLPPLGGRGVAIDLSPMLALFVLFILQAIVVGLIDG